MPTEITRPPESLEQALADLWEQVDRRWDDPVAHQKLLDVADTCDRLAWLAGRYREAIEAAPDRARGAKVYQEAIVVRALARLPLRPASKSRSARFFEAVGRTTTLADSRKFATIIVIVWLVLFGAAWDVLRRC